MRLSLHFKYLCFLASATILLPSLAQAKPHGKQTSPHNSPVCSQLQIKYSVGGKSKYMKREFCHKDHIEEKADRRGH